MRGVSDENPSRHDLIVVVKARGFEVYIDHRRVGNRQGAHDRIVVGVMNVDHGLL
jgi:hypothetical protein